MNQVSITLLVFLSLLFSNQVRAQSSPSRDAVSNFQPSLVVVIGILGLMFALTFVLLVFAKLCQHRDFIPLGATNNQLPTLLRSRSRFSGIDKTVIESLPFFKFSSLRGLKDGLECAICLSKFEDREILRLLPKCKHAFHIDCIDHWLEKHSSCPICRHKVNPEDQTIFSYSNSFRMMVGEESNIEILVQREEEQQQHGSSRFNIGSSLRKFGKSVFTKEEEMPIQKEEESGEKGYHKHNHKITISDVVFKHRWSNVSSSDLMFLNSEMVNALSSERFNNFDMSNTKTVVENNRIMNFKEETERKICLERKVDEINKSNKSVSDFEGSLSDATRYVNSGDKRSVSEITAVSRFGDFKKSVFEQDSSSLLENNLKEERMRQLWFPIAKRTAQWFVNREKRSQQSQNKQQPLDV